jgi:hypothetical protein
LHSSSNTVCSREQYSRQEASCADFVTGKDKHQITA